MTDKKMKKIYDNLYYLEKISRKENVSDEELYKIISQLQKISNKYKRLYTHSRRTFKYNFENAVELFLFIDKCDIDVERIDWCLFPIAKINLLLSRIYQKLGEDQEALKYKYLAKSYAPMMNVEYSEKDMKRIKEIYYLHDEFITSPYLKKDFLMIMNESK